LAQLFYAFEYDFCGCLKFEQSRLSPGSNVTGLKTLKKYSSHRMWSLTLNNRQEGGLIHSQKPTLQIQRSFERLKVATSPRNLGTQSSS